MSITKVTDAGLDRNRIITPIIINGDMSVAQRGTSSTSTGIKTCDRWTLRTDNTDNLAVTQAQSTTVPGYGFKFSYKYDTTTAESALAADEKLSIETRIEANSMQGLKYGTAQAEATTLGFWCKGSLTGVHGMYIRTHDGAQEFVQSYTIDTADTWEFKTINIPANTEKVINSDTGLGWWIQWGLGAGADIDGATLGSWHDNATEVFPANQVNYMANTSYEFLLTGVQLEIGTFDNNTMPDFPFESFENNLKKCQRYYQLISEGADTPIGLGTYYASGTVYVPSKLSPPMRTTPSVDQVTGTNYYIIYRAGGNDPFNSLAFDVGNTMFVDINNGDTVSGTAGQSGMGRLNNSSSKLAFVAEL